MKKVDYLMQYFNGPCILDVGCASHFPEPDSLYWIHGRIRRKFIDVYGIDINKDNLKILENLGYSNIYLKNAESFDFGSLKFDTVFAGELIEHLSNPGLFLKMAKESIKDNGRIIIRTPYPFALINMIYAFLKYPKTCQNNEHTSWFCLQTIKELASRELLKITHLELVEDYRIDKLPKSRNDRPSNKYLLFASIFQLVKWFIPKRLRGNSMLVILEK